MINHELQRGYWMMKLVLFGTLQWARRHNKHWPNIGTWEHELCEYVLGSCLESSGTCNSMLLKFLELNEDLKAQISSVSKPSSLQPFPYACCIYLMIDYGTSGVIIFISIVDLSIPTFFVNNWCEERSWFDLGTNASEWPNAFNGMLQIWKW
jgi:hypothetical protein